MLGAYLKDVVVKSIATKIKIEKENLIVFQINVVRIVVMQYLVALMIAITY
jgi:hypothetical protein